jgi:CHAT domain-containing protein/Tfp pilus assembly protein PilF
LLGAQGEYAKAEPFFRDSLSMRLSLYPRDKYPQGHRDLIQSLNNLAALLRTQGKDAEAEPYYRDALSMCRSLYPKDQFPQGHPLLAASLNNLGFLLQVQGDYAKAEPYYRDALVMRQQFYPKDQYPQGHPELAESLNNLGTLLYAQGEYAKAEQFFRDTLTLHQQLYPKDRYPQGHPDLAQSLNNLGALLYAQGEYAKAEPYYRDALTMHQALTTDRAQSAGEAPALNFAASLPRTRDGFLSVTRHLPDATVPSYVRLWQTKAALTRVYERRHLAVLAATSSEVHQRWQMLLALRRQRERLLLASVPTNPTARDQQLAELSQQIDRRDRELLQLLPAAARTEQRARSQPAELQKHLPPRTVLIDLLRYLVVEHDPKLPGSHGQRRTPNYLAYVLSHAGIQRVELGPAAPIEEAVHAWRQSLTAWKPALPEPARRDLEQRAASQAEALRRLVWEPLAGHLPAQTQTVYLAPDAALTRLPWAALPGKATGRVLLEEYALAVLPHGPFLLDQLTAPARQDRSGEGLLVVGGVRYDDRPPPLPVAAKDDPGIPRSGAPAEDLSWDYLVGSERELQQVAALAQGKPVRSLSGVEANTERLLAELPRVRYTHLATHGFFADKSFRSVLQLDEKLFARRELLTGQVGERIGEGARHPLVLSGLVLAGANHKDVPDRGIVTADAIVGLNLTGLELAVLSACDTGLGDVAGGEGVFGLQRAFHLAGTKNVIASLWNVDDQATAALMTLFYRNLWQEKLPAIEALRQAQLAIYHQPEHIPAWAMGERGPGLKPLPATTAANRDQPAALAGKAPVKLWAAFVLSGSGQ